VPYDERLTILLTLHGRHPFTLRWLAYADATRFPFPVYIADGSPDDRVQDVLAETSRFSHVAYEYVRYPPDWNYAGFYAKVADALARIRTPFVALGDNDDFFLASGVQQALAFLAEHPDHATCGGQMAAFWVTPHTHASSEGPVYGDIEWKCSNDARALDGGTARERLRTLSQWAGYPIYHHVRRTAQLRELFRMLCAADLKDIFLHELFLAFLTAIAGKTRQLDELYMAKQLNSPGSSAGAHSAAHGDWLGRMLAPSWSNDFARFLEATSAALAERDHLPRDDARRYIVEAYRMAVAPALAADIMKEPTATLRGTVALGVTRRLLAMSPGHPVRRFARAMYRRVPWISPDIMQGTQLRGTRVPHAAEEIGPIHRFLTRPTA
jgi:glycosyltransferase domain-containing protein